MGITLIQWRIRIGTFSQRVRLGMEAMAMICLGGGISCTIRFCTLYLALCCVGTFDPEADYRMCTNSGTPLCSSYITETAYQPLGAPWPGEYVSVDDQRTSFSGCRHRQRVLKINLLTSGDIETNPGPGTEPQEFESVMSSNTSKTRSTTRQTKLSASDGNLAMKNDDQPSLGDVMNELKTMNGKIDNVITSLNELKTETKRIDNRCAAVENGMAELKNENRQLKQKLDNLDSHSRRNNLIIQGIPENQNQESWQKCEDAVLKCFKDELNIQEEVAIESAHRLPKPKQIKQRREGPRDIIIRLSFFKDKVTIMDKAREIKPKGLFVREDFSEGVRMARNKMSDMLSTARNLKLKSYLSFNKLIVVNNDNKKNIYMYDEAADAVKKVKDSFDDNIPATTDKTA